MIKGFQKTSLIDYPGKIVSTVFFQGCNFRCPFCHNPDLVLPEKFNEDKIEIKTILEHLENNKMFLDGICITGGEPTLSHELLDLMKSVKKLNFLIKLDTNGTNPNLLKQIISEKLVDYIAMDIKGPFEKYDLIVKMKVNIEDIKKSVEIIKNSGIDYEFRTTILPSLHSKKEIIEMLKKIGKFKLFSMQQFRANNTLDINYMNEGSFSKIELEEIKKEILEKNLVDNCIIKGAN